MFFDDRGGPTEREKDYTTINQLVCCLSFFFLWFVTKKPTKSVALLPLPPSSREERERERDHHRIPWSPPTVASRSATSQSKLLHADMDMDRPSDDRTDPSIEDSGMSSDSEWSPMPGSS